MNKTLWNSGWRLQTGGSFFDAFGTADEGSVPVRLPHDAMLRRGRRPEGLNGPSMACYDGDLFLYRKRWTPAEEERGEEQRLYFEGVLPNAMVYVNREFAGKCENGYLPFSVRIDPFVRWGEENEVRVLVHAGIPRTSRWYVGAGICRNVWLCRGAGAVVENGGVRVRTEQVSAQGALVLVQTDVRSLQRPREVFRLSTRLLAPDGTCLRAGEQPVTLADGGSAVLQNRFWVARPRLWSPGTPSLYTVCSTLLSPEGTVLGTEECRFGIRSLSFDPVNGMRLNGETIKLRGGCVHHDAALLGALSCTESELRRARLLKQAGFNAVRSSHNPMSEAFLDACDRVGLLVMDELGDCWNTGKTDHDYSLLFEQNWRGDLRAMVEKDYNHPCVFCYSIGNEIPETGCPQGYEQTRQMAELLRGLDASRPVCCCINAMFSVMDRMARIVSELTHGADTAEQSSDINAMMVAFATRMPDIMRHPIVTRDIEETCAALDICGYNYMDARYREDHERWPDRVIVGSETNARRIAENWALIAECPHVLGDFCWTAVDYLGEAEEGSFASGAGDIDLTGRRKAKSYYRETVWGLRSAPYIGVGRPEKYGQDEHLNDWGWPDMLDSWTWRGSEGKTVRVHVYTDAPEAALYLDGRLLEKRAVGTEKPFEAVFDVEYRPGELAAAAVRDGVPAERTALQTAGRAAELRLWAEPREEKGDLMYIRIDAVDAGGRVDTCASQKVQLQTEGPAELLGFGSAALSGGESYADSACTLFDGRLLAVVRRTGEGTVRLCACAGGLAGRLEL